MTRMMKRCGMVMTVMLAMMMVMVKIIEKMMMIVHFCPGHLVQLVKNCAGTSNALRAHAPSYTIVFHHRNRCWGKNSGRENDMAFELGLVCKESFSTIILVLWWPHLKKKIAPIGWSSLQLGRLLLGLARLEQGASRLRAQFQSEGSAGGAF